MGIKKDSLRKDSTWNINKVEQVSFQFGGKISVTKPTAWKGIPQSRRREEMEHVVILSS